MGLAAAVLGDKFYWWLDPAGAVLLAIYTISNWSGTVWENAGLLPSLPVISLPQKANFLVERFCKLFTRASQLSNNIASNGTFMNLK